MNDDQLCPYCEKMVQVEVVVLDDTSTVNLKCLDCNALYFDPGVSKDPLEKKEGGN